MNRRAVSVLGLLVLPAAILVLAMVTFAQNGADKPYPEGQGAEKTGSYVAPVEAERAPEGTAGKSGRLEGANPEQRAPEGTAGKSGRLEGTNPEQRERLEGAGGQNLLYSFSGVTDDGLQGAPGHKEATSIHCTNLDSSIAAQVEVQVYQWNGTDVYTGTRELLANETATYSTQPTAIYFDDVILGGNPGTPAILQGSGRILSSHSNVICSAQAIDPGGNPPNFATSLELFRK